ncbi:hypothetical protein ACFL5V_08895 [Fibrobacterota bacterium]
MGKSATFFMDDVSIFDNAANINVFPNFLIGEMGSYLQGDVDRDAIGDVVGQSVGYNALTRYNRDPQNPWFGGIFSYSLSRREEGNLYPQLSIGGAFNRRDLELLALLPDSVTDKNGETSVVPDPVTNADGFLGFTLKNGGMIGSHIYVAVQEGANVVNGELGVDTSGSPLFSHKISTYIFKGDVGFNWPLARNVDGEFSFGLATVRFGPSSVTWQNSFFMKARSFSTLELINGELVPIISYSNYNAPGLSESSLNIGIGVNASLDRGFFWLGVESVFDKTEKTGYYTSGESGDREVYDVNDTRVSEEIIQGGKISFGIERNVWWDWLVVRVGGQKLIAYREQRYAGKKSYHLTTNPISNGTQDDHVGWGLGLNVEEKLKFDVTMSEDFPYTLGNILSGPQHHVLTRISATYSF